MDRLAVSTQRKSVVARTEVPDLYRLLANSCRNQRPAVARKSQAIKPARMGTYLEDLLTGVQVKHHEEWTSLHGQARAVVIHEHAHVHACVSALEAPDALASNRIVDPD